MLKFTKSVLYGLSRMALSYRVTPEKEREMRLKIQELKDKGYPFIPDDSAENAIQIMEQIKLKKRKGQSKKYEYTPPI